MSRAKGLRRCYAVIAKEATRPVPALCEYDLGCGQKPAYRVPLWTGRVVFTCAKHTPDGYRSESV